jgi:hypothetical protein
MKSIFFRVLMGPAALLSGLLSAQTTVDLRAQSRNVDFSAAIATKPFKTGAVLPAACAAGESYFKTDAAPGQNLYVCTATNTWTQLTGIPGVAVANSGPGAVELLKSGSGLGVVTGRQILTGEGTLVTQQTDTVSVETDTAVTPRYATASTAPTGACQTGRDQFVRVSSFPHVYSCVNGAWKPVYAVTSTAPTACFVGEIYFNPGDSGLYGCTAVNTWTRFNRSGVDLSLTGECFITYSCTPTSAFSRTTLPAVATAGGVMMLRVVIPHVLKLARALMFVSDGGVNHSFTAAIYQDNNGTPGAKIDGTDLRIFNLGFAAFRQVTWGSGTTILSPAVYWIGMSSEAPTALFHVAGASFSTAGQLTAMLGGVLACSNQTDGAGNTYTLPDTCGTATAVSNFNDAPVIVSAAQ